MNIKLDALEIPKDDPFKYDVLERKSSAEILTQFISSIDKPFVLAVDSSWGTGKTTFVEMLMQHMSNEAFPTLYFSAWENDFSDDPIVSLVGELHDSISKIAEHKGQDSSAITKAIDSVKKYSPHVAKKVIPVIVKFITAGTLDSDKLVEEVAKSASDFSSDLVDRYQMKKRDIKIFKNRLEELVDKIRPPEEKGCRKPLTIFIDELDRCRPSYAIELLEGAKHLFDIPGIVFVISLDKEQLEKSARCLYGNDLDAAGYLRRFIDVDYALPLPSKESFCRFLCSRVGLRDYFKHRQNQNALISINDEDVVTAMSDISNALDLSLREIEHCFTRLVIVLRCTPPNRALFTSDLCNLIALKVKAPRIYKRIVANQIADSELGEFFMKHSGGAEFWQSESGRMFRVLAIANKFDSENIGQGIQEYATSLQVDSIDENVREFTLEVIQGLNEIRNRRAYKSICSLDKRISMTEEFVLR